MQAHVKLCLHTRSAQQETLQTALRGVPCHAASCEALCLLVPVLHDVAYICSAASAVSYKRQPILMRPRSPWLSHRPLTGQQSVRTHRACSPLIVAVEQIAALSDSADNAHVRQSIAASHRLSHLLPC